MCVSICIHLHTNTHVQSHGYTYIHIYTYINIYIYAYRHIYTYIITFNYIYTYIHIYIYTYIHIYIYTYIHMHIYIYTDIYIYVLHTKTCIYNHLHTKEASRTSRSNGIGWMMNLPPGSAAELGQFAGLNTKRSRGLYSSRGKWCRMI